MLARRQSFDLPAGPDGAPIDGIGLYRALRRVNPEPVPVLHPDAGRSRSSARARSSSSRSRATGCPRTRSPARGRAARRRRDDDRLADELRGDPKERAEHVMLVDLGRNDLGPRRRGPGTRDDQPVHGGRALQPRPPPREPRRGASSARTCDALDALRAVFPAGTLTGAPKIRAMQLIAAAEGERRGLYGGAVGYLGYDGNLDTAITIRSAVLKDGQAHVHTGAGIVARSASRRREFEETEHKAAAMQPGHRARGVATPVRRGPAAGRVRRRGPEPRGRGAMILMIDNYDSFTFNLVQALQAAGRRRPRRAQRRDHAGRRSRRIADDPAADAAGDRDLARARRPRARPACRSPPIEVAARSRIPLLGVCLGMQSMGAAFGASIVRAPTLVHGEAIEVVHDGDGAARGHARDVPGRALPLAVRRPGHAARGPVRERDLAEDGVVMGLRHRSLPIEGVQFHPESVLTPDGPHLLANFLRLAGEGEALAARRGVGLVRDARHGRASPRWATAAGATRRRGASRSRGDERARPRGARGDRRRADADARRGARSRWAPSWTARRRRPSSRRC